MRQSSSICPGIAFVAFVAFPPSKLGCQLYREAQHPNCRFRIPNLKDSRAFFPTRGVDSANRVRKTGRELVRLRRSRTSIIGVADTKTQRSVKSAIRRPMSDVESAMSITLASFQAGRIGFLTMSESRRATTGSASDGTASSQCFACSRWKRSTSVEEPLRGRLARMQFYQEQSA